MASSLSVMYDLSVSLIDGLCQSCFLLLCDLAERVSVGVCVLCWFRCVWFLCWFRCVLVMFSACGHPMVEGCETA